MTERDIFIAALQQDDPDSRRACLVDACGSNAALRAQVEELLAVHGRADRFLESPPAELNGRDSPAVLEQPGTVIGPYKLLEQIGEGGFGIVFMAEQTEPVRRRVALKVLKAGMDTKQVIARFEAERQAVALMGHPNIARILDGGATAAGRPYFVMELVRGVAITDYCDQHRLPPRDRLELFVQVCQAVQHARQKGVIHRDLKPSNVLVEQHDTVPVAKVIDFGVAKALGQELTDKTLFTAFAQLVGTPLYMSPEQAGLSGLDVDTRSDVYSLGVLLYELLTGATPFDRDRLRAAGYDELRRIIREEEPAKPSTRLSTLGPVAETISTNRGSEPRRLTALVRGELDWIAMKCLEKDRTRRYESAGALAADVQRYLNDEPVQACPPSAGYRVRKFVRRNRVALATACLIAAALLIGTAVSAWQAIEAHAARKQTAKALGDEQLTRRESDAHAHRAEANSLRAHEAVERFLTRVGKQSLATEPRTERVRRELLQDALKFYQGFLAEQPDDPASRHEAARAHLRVAYIHAYLGENPKAEEATGRAAELMQALLDASPDLDRYRLTMAKVLNNQGALHARQKRLDRAEECFTRGLDLLGGTGLGDAPSEESVVLCATLRTNLGNVCRQANRKDEAEKNHRQALADYDRLVEQAPRSVEHRRGWAATRRDLAATLEGARDPEAAAEYRRAIDVQRFLVVEQPDDPELRDDLAIGHFNLANVLERAGQVPQALEAVQEAAGLWAGVAVEHPAVKDYAVWSEAANKRLIVLGTRTGQTGVVEVACRHLLRVAEARAARSPKEVELHRRVALLRSNLAQFLCDRPDPEPHKVAETLALAHQAVAFNAKEWRYWASLGMANYRTGRWQDAIQAMEGSMKLHGRTSLECFYVAMALHRLGEKDQAREWYAHGTGWMSRHKSADEDRQQRLRAEAAALIGTKDSQESGPDRKP